MRSTKGVGEAQTKSEGGWSPADMFPVSPSESSDSAENREPDPPRARTRWLRRIEKRRWHRSSSNFDLCESHSGLNRVRPPSAFGHICPTPSCSALNAPRPPPKIPPAHPKERRPASSPGWKRLLPLVTWSSLRCYRSDPAPLTYRPRVAHVPPMCRSCAKRMMFGRWRQTSARS